MAEIYGVSVKKVRCDADHEGCAMFSADVWYNKKKLGRWSQSYMCGPAEFDFNEDLLDEAVEKYKNSDFVEPMYKDIIDAGILIDAVIRMTEDEKNFKKGLKNGFQTFVVQEHGYRNGFWTVDGDIEHIKGLKDYKELTERGEKVAIYTDSKDFMIA